MRVKISIFTEKFERLFFLKGGAKLQLGILGWCFGPLEPLTISTLKSLKAGKTSTAWEKHSNDSEHDFFDIGH